VRWANIIRVEDESHFFLDGSCEHLLNDTARVQIAIKLEISSDVGGEEEATAP
jgi:hypothetical protein